MTYQEKFDTELKAFERRATVITDSIRENPNAHHNELRRIVVDKKRAMAVRTFDKIIRELLISGRIVSQIKRRKKYYYFPGAANFDVEDYVRQMRDSLILYAKWTNRLERLYPKSTLDDNVSFSVIILRSLFDLLNLLAIVQVFRIIPPETISQLEQTTKAQIKDVLDIVSTGKESEEVVRAIVSHIKPLPPDVAQDSFSEVTGKTFKLGKK